MLPLAQFSFVEIFEMNLFVRWCRLSRKNNIKERTMLSLATGSRHHTNDYVTASPAQCLDHVVFPTFRFRSVPSMLPWTVAAASQLSA